MKQIKIISLMILSIGLMFIILLINPKGIFNISQGKLDAPRERILTYQIIKENNKTFVKYRYISNRESPAEKGEDITKRTKNAKFFKLGEKNGKEVWQSKIYCVESTWKIDGKWFAIETGTTSSGNFFWPQLTLFDKLGMLFLGNAYATTTSYTANGSGVGGITRCTGSGGDWETFHSDVSGNSVNAGGTNMEVDGEMYYSGCNVQIGRVFIPVNTSGLTSSASISSAVLYVYDMGYSSGGTVGVVQTFQASPTGLVLSDYSKCGNQITNPTEGASRITFSGGGGTGWNGWTLNSTGLSWISKTGWTYLGLREAHDMDNNSAGICNQRHYRTFAGPASGNPPYLSITYTITCNAPSISNQPTSPASICSAGSANITGLAATGDTPLSYQWKYNSSNVTDGTPSGASYTNQTTATLSVSGITGAGNYQYSCYISNSCGNITSNPATVTVLPIFTAGSILTTGQTICYNCNPAQIGSSVDASGGNGSISYQWQSSTTSSSTGFGDISGATSASYDPPAGLTVNTWYRRQAKDGTCNTSFTVSSGEWLVTVTSPTTVDWNNSNVQEITLAADRSLVFANG
ncbi:MAG: immunoglobulin domain-containing protein, partial [Bacteroidetes bacterium]|nr:immunoglobulin domain-containing protein [Bacteroidota bacterium]